MVKQSGGKKLDFQQEENVRFWGSAWKVFFTVLNSGILFRIKEKKRKKDTHLLISLLGLINLSAGARVGCGNHHDRAGVSGRPHSLLATISHFPKLNEE